jgi:NAD(P)H-dependent FMN reductase
VTERPLRIVALEGSLKATSANAALLRAAQAVAPEGLSIEVPVTLGEIPPLDPDLDAHDGSGPEPVERLRAALRDADGLLVASPEYAHSLPGTLKNALDWLVGSGELHGLPVALLSASTTMTGGLRAQMALLQTLLAHGAFVAVQYTLPGVKGKLDASGELTGERVRRRLRETLVALAEGVEESRGWRAGPDG